MSTGNGTRRVDTVVVGGGQAGLVTGRELARSGREYLVLDGGERVGDAWRNRWDSLRLFTPRSFDGLPGLRFPGPNAIAPTKDEMADYLEAYAKRFDIPVRLGARVERVSRRNGRFLVSGKDFEIEAANVVVATGAFSTPKTPPFADELDDSIVQVHSAHYRNQSQLRGGDTLIVGMGNSGADIAMDLAGRGRVYLSGKPSAVIPFRVDTRHGRVLIRVVRFAGHHVLTWRTPIGRKVLPKLKAKATPLIRVKPKDLTAAGVQNVARVAGVRNGRPLLDDGTVLDVANVIWATGFGTEYPWLELDAFDGNGGLAHKRGIAEREPGLYFVGLMMQFSASSETLIGVGRDAHYVVRHLAKRTNGRAPAAANAALR